MLPALAWPQQGPAAAGVLELSQEAAAGGGPLSAGSTVYSGELVTTGKSGQVQIRLGKGRFALGRLSNARFFRSGDLTVVQLQNGVLTYSASNPSGAVTIYAGDAKFVPASFNRAAGQIQVSSNCEISATVLQGKLEATTGKETVVIDQKERYIVHVPVGVEFKDHLSSSGKDFPPDWSDPRFHLDHEHIACADADPKPPVKRGMFEKVVFGAGVVTTGVLLIRAFESPEHP